MVWTNIIVLVWLRTEGPRKEADRAGRPPPITAGGLKSVNST